MPKKILVLESDQAAADDLRHAFGHFDVTLDVIGDGNEGLDRARELHPDLILLCIELPRVNGFSICNKLKKNNDLKDIPLIIMSRDATEETFEQHRKLRTRAEDYIRKPFAFEDLMEKIRPLVEFEEATGGESLDDPIALDDEIQLDDAISIDDASDLGVEEMDERTAVITADSLAPPPEPVEPEAAVPGEEIAEFTDDAFDSLVLSEEAVPGASAAPEAAEPERAASMPPHSATSTAAPRAEAERPRASGSRTDSVELERLREENTRLKRELDEAIRSTSRENEELKNSKREVEELRAKLAKGGVSSKEFLDLRERLNRKDKEILDLRDSVQSKEKATLDVRDRVNALERERANLNDQILAHEKELEEARELVIATRNDKETVEKRSADIKARLERSQQEIEKAYREVDEEKRAKEAALEEAAQEKRNLAVLEEELSEHEQARQAALAEAEQGKAAALAEAQEAAHRAAEAEANRMIERHSRDMGVLGSKLAETEQGLTLARESAQAFQADKARLEQELTTLRGERDSMDSDLGVAREQIGNLETTVTEQKARVAELEERGAHHEERALRAHRKIQEDGQVVDKAKKAVAIALQLLDEQIRPGNEE